MSHDCRNIRNDPMSFGIHIANQNDSYHIHEGTLPDYAQNVILNPGWNLVGFPSKCSLTLQEATADLLGPLFLWGFDPFGDGRVSILGFTSDMNPGEGFWIHSTISQSWIIEGRGDSDPLPPFDA